MIKLFDHFLVIFLGRTFSHFVIKVLEVSIFLRLDRSFFIVGGTAFEMDQVLKEENAIILQLSLQVGVRFLRGEEVDELLICHRDLTPLSNIRHFGLFLSVLKLLLERLSLHLGLIAILEPIC